MLSPSAKTTIRRKLLAWYDAHRRELPWREQPSAYATWVSEVMLQQTRVEVVRDYYKRFMHSYPSVTMLAQADEADVLRLWQGLGYYSRAKRLLEGARHVAQHCAGVLPDDPQQLQKIPGIGPYSAGAIASISYGKRAPLVDGNVIRVLTRLFALPGDPQKGLVKAALWELADQLVSPSRPGDFNQALMELGALVCRPKAPACLDCPLRADCRARREGEAERFPELKKRARPTELSMVTVLLRRGSRVGVHSVPASARWWAGLDAFPFEDVARPGDAAATALGLVERHADPRGDLRALPVVKHSVTRFRVQLHPFEVEVGIRDGNSTLRWVAPQEASQLSLPAAHMKVLRTRFALDVTELEVHQERNVRRRASAARGRRS